MKPGTLYRFFDADGNLLYVGASSNAPARLEQHRRDKSWWSQVASCTMEHYEHRYLAVAAEVHAIREEKPRHNKSEGTFEGRPVERITEEECERRRMLRTMYPVKDLRCQHCDWEGNWVKKGVEVKDAPCANCGLLYLTGTPIADPTLEAVA